MPTEETTVPPTLRQHIQEAIVSGRPYRLTAEEAAVFMAALRARMSAVEQAPLPPLWR